jgi:polysaccharide biosynthesis/export protein
MRHRLTFFSLTSLYASCFTLPGAMAWMLLFSGGAIGQTIRDPQQDSLTQQLLEEARQRVMQRESTVEANPFLFQEDFSTYRLGPGDSVYVNVLRFADLSFQGTIDQQGNMIVPLVGALSFKGLTVEQAREQIRIGLDRYVINPQVDVILIAQRPVQVTVAGEVVKPGFYPLQAPQLATAIVAAGGTTGLADLRTIRIRRTLEDGSILEKDFDLFSPLRDSMAIPDIRLADGDTVIIPTLTAATDSDYDRNLVSRSTIAQQFINIRVLNRASPTGGTIGSIQIPNGSTFLDAMTTISPDLSSANLRDVALIRYDVQQGKAIAFELNAKDALMGDMSQNPRLEHNDVIVVGRNFIARITHALNTFTQPFRDVLGFLLFFDSLSNSASNLFQPTGSSSSRR